MLAAKRSGGPDVYRPAEQPADVGRSIQAILQAPGSMSSMDQDPVSDLFAKLRLNRGTVEQSRGLLPAELEEMKSKAKGDLMERVPYPEGLGPGKAIQGLLGLDQGRGAKKKPIEVPNRPPDGGLRKPRTRSLPRSFRLRGSGQGAALPGRPVVDQMDVGDFSDPRTLRGGGILQLGATPRFRYLSRA